MRLRWSGSLFILGFLVLAVLLIALERGREIKTTTGRIYDEWIELGTGARSNRKAQSPRTLIQFTGLSKLWIMTVGCDPDGKIVLRMLLATGQVVGDGVYLELAEALSIPCQPFQVESLFDSDSQENKYLLLDHPCSTSIAIGHALADYLICPFDFDYLDSASLVKSPLRVFMEPNK